MNCLKCLILVVAVSSVVSAQTTGVPFINDYTINGFGSGSTSCTAVAISASAFNVLNVSTTPGVAVTFVFSACPCLANAVPLPPVPCAIPFTANFGLSNQSGDLSIVAGCPTRTIVAVADAFGNATVILPPFSFPVGDVLGTQASIRGPACAPFTNVLTQAYDMIIVP